MKLVTNDGTFELAEYNGISDSAIEFARWFKSEFNVEYFDYTNRDAFFDDFRWGFLEQDRYSGILHTNFAPKFFDDVFYKQALEKLAEEFAERGRKAYFCWP